MCFFRGRVHVRTHRVSVCGTTYVSMDAEYDTYDCPTCAERLGIERSLAASRAQDSLFNAMFKSLPVGRRMRVAMSHLRWAAEEAGRDPKDVIRELRSEFKLTAKWRAEDAAKDIACDDDVDLAKL